MQKTSKIASFQLELRRKIASFVQLSSSNDGKIASFCFEELHWGHPWPERQRNKKALLPLHPSFRHHRKSHPAKTHTQTHNIIHSFIHSLQACSHWPSASECSVSAPPSFSSPLRPSGSKKSGRAPNSHHISFRPHHDTKQNLSLSLLHCKFWIQPVALCTETRQH